MKKIFSLLLAGMLVMSSCFIAVAQNSRDNEEYTDFTENEDFELTEYGLGLILDENNSDNCIIDYDETNAERYNNINNRDLPSSVDLSAEDAFPKIRSQGNVNSCTSWASVYYQFGYQVAHQVGWNAKNSPSKQFSPKFVYNYVSDGQNGSTSITWNYNLLKIKGAVKYAHFSPNPYIDNNPDPLDITKLNPLEYRAWCTDENSLKEALMYKVSDYEIRDIISSSSGLSTPITGASSPCLATMKNLLNNNHVLTFGTNYGKQDNRSNYNIVTGYSNGFTNINWNYKMLSSGNHSGEKVCVASTNQTAIDYPEEANRHHHALSIVGYDDTIWYDYDEDGVQDDYELGAFKIANSHGTGYGNGGFMWIMYDAINKISNCSAYNNNRLPVIEGLRYYTIEIKKSDRDLVAKITLSQSNRRQHNKTLSVSDTDNTIISSYTDYNRVIGFRYDGTQSSEYQTAPFLLDYDIIVSGNRNWQNYQIEISDILDSPTTYISDIAIVDRTGKTVVYETYNDYISNQSETFNYYIAMVGDVNNDSYINVFDTIMIQNHLSGATTLTNNQILAADVNGDGVITNIDANLISQYSAEIITQFPNGAFVQLE